MGHSLRHMLTIALHRRTGRPTTAFLDFQMVSGSCVYLDEFGMVLHSGATVSDSGFVDSYAAHEPDALAEVEDLHLGFPWTYVSWVGDGIDISEDDLLVVMIEQGEEL